MPVNLYAEEIVAQYEHPHNKGKLENESISMRNQNMLCGDDVTMHLKITGNRITDIKFEGAGCAISIATASMLTDSVKGKALKDIEGMGVQSVFKLLGFDPGPARLKCATLPLRALKEAVFAYQHKKVDAETQKL
jgi:nitrogen fixation NifU-like protein